MSKVKIVAVIEVDDNPTTITMVVTGLKRDYDAKIEVAK